MEQDFESVGFDVKISQKEFIKANFFIAYSNPISIIVSFFSILVTYGLISANIRDGSNSSLLIFFALFTIFFPGIILMNSIKNYKNRLVQENKEYNFTNEGISIHSVSSHVELKWIDFKKIKSSRNALFIFLTNNQAIIIPKRCLKAETYQLIISHAKVKIKKIKRKNNILIPLIIIVILVFIGVINFLAQQNN